MQGGDGLYFKVLWLLHFFVGCVSFHIHFFFFFFFLAFISQGSLLSAFGDSPYKKKKKSKPKALSLGCFQEKGPGSFQTSLEKNRSQPCTRHSLQESL